ncbi:MAG: sigma-70 family RNA polymerase sigma factor [Planctomycetota bacterium]|nr:sigma-70 family RNA polymerase sigma factor [Planctomycetota bacterium]
MNKDYRSQQLAQLANQQVRFAPIEKRIEQINRAEQLLHEVKAETTYSYEYLCFKITEYRPETSEIEAVRGSDVIHDLHLLIEDLSDSANIRAEETGEPVHTVDELSKMFNVSTKTISRWRRQGLVSRKLIFDRGRKRVGFLRSSVDQFLRLHGDKVRRGEKFSQLTLSDKEEILDRARRLSLAGERPADVTRQVAERMGRSIETIRYTIRQFDQQHPDLAIFPDLTGPLTRESKERLYRDFLDGISAESLARRFNRTSNSIYRIVGEMRANEILDLPLDYIDSEEFHEPQAGEKILTEMPEPETVTRRVKPPAGLPPYLSRLYETTLLTREQEYHQFRKFNYLKFLACRLRDQLEPSDPRTGLMDEFENLLGEAAEIKNFLVQSNLRLVVSIAKRHVTSGDEFYQLVSDGNMSLFRAVEKFDYSRGNKFSTYASWAIMKNFARSIPEEFKQRDRFRTSSEETFMAAPDDRLNNYQAEIEQDLRETAVNKILESLDEREQQIIISRFGLNHQNEPQTLKEVGREIGVTKERVRQIEARALVKLRAEAEKQKIDFVEDA